jgi:hypothetical protein
MSQTLTATRALMQRISGHDVYDGFTPELPEDTQGWNSESPAFREVVQRLRPKLIIEIGVWKGATTINLAKLLRELGIDGCVIAIDVFLGSFDPPYNGWMPWRNGRAMIYEQFLCNIVHQKLEDYVIPLPQLSRYGMATLKRLNVVADLIHVDAGHEYENVSADLAMSWELLRPGGCLIADDYDPSWTGVVQAVTELAKLKNVAVIDRRPKAVLWKS